ncbi:MAG: hypothetical protein JJU11_18645 [Candidatus Sumerlaeia bacterium]|nr:hypothetical protein [Candidatus Sumerlaeia bacterium]
MMTVRTFNYTKRKKIERKHVKVYVTEGEDGAHFDATIKIADYNFPPESRIYVEAYRRTSYMRFDFGTVGNNNPPSDRRLLDFDFPQDILYRVKVIDVTGKDGRILGEANGIRGAIAGTDDDDRLPLLPVKPEDLGHEIWKVDFDAHGTTRLLVNSKIHGCMNIARTPLFIAMVYPQVLREILFRALLHDSESLDLEDMLDWRAQWIKFASELPGSRYLSQNEQDENKIVWINEAVAAFSRKHRCLDAYKSIRNGGRT